MTASTEPSDPNATDQALNRSTASPLSWSTLKFLIQSSNLVELARSEEQKLTYRLGREDIRKSWDCIYDYLLCVKFGFAEAMSEETGKKRSVPTFEELRSERGTENSGACRMMLCLNDYPYYLESGIEHWILWKLGGDVEEKEIEKAKYKLLCQGVGRGCDDDGIEMKVHVGSTVPTAPNVKSDLTEMVHDDTIFLHWVNPTHLKR
jgi:hypothetical protein